MSTRRIVITTLIVEFAFVGLGAMVLLSRPAKRPPVINATPAVKGTTAPLQRALPTAPVRTARVVFVGDIMLGRNVEGIVKQQGQDYPFVGITDLLAEADLAVANLEGPIIKQHKRTPTGSTSFSFPPSVAATLSRHGVDLVSLANNHTFDRGASGFIETGRYLTAAGVTPFGHPRNAKVEYVTTRVVGGKSMTFVGFNDVFGVLDSAAAVALVSDLTATAPEYFLVVEIHWGDEYKPKHNARQERLAHELITAGADLVVGHHPHVVQDIEVYKGKAIFYSLGNFIFDQYFSRPTQEGLMIELEIKDDVTVYHLIPVDITKSQPRPMTVTKTAEWLANLSQRSESELRPDIATGIINLPAAAGVDNSARDKKN